MLRYYLHAKAFAIPPERESKVIHPSGQAYMDAQYSLPCDPLNTICQASHPALAALAAGTPPAATRRVGLPGRALATTGAVGM